VHKVSILITHFDQISLTCKCVATILSTDIELLNIIIVDNSLSRADKEYAIAEFVSKGYHFNVMTDRKSQLDFKSNIYWFTAHQNLGYAGGMNLAAEIAMLNDPEFLLFINNDTEIPANFLNEFLNELDPVVNQQDFGFASCLIKTLPDHNIWYAGGKLNLSRCMGEHATSVPIVMEVQETGFISGCCMLFRPDVYKHLNGMDEKFFLYYEDVDLCYRAIKQDYKLYFVPNVELFHRVGSSTGGDDKPLSVFYSSRNRILLMRKHFKGFILYRFYAFFFFSRLLKLSKWLVMGRQDLIQALFKGIHAGLLS
jgi:GT2 family glycosyltransferase